jgi:hypothetical protein
MWRRQLQVAGDLLFDWPLAMRFSTSTWRSVSRAVAGALATPGPAAASSIAAAGCSARGHHQADRRAMTALLVDFGREPATPSAAAPPHLVVLAAGDTSTGTPGAAAISRRPPRRVLRPASPGR